MGDILKRAGLIESTRRRRRPLDAPRRTIAAEAANDEWAADFKGWFRTQDQRRVDPLTITDSHTRFLIEHGLCWVHAERLIHKLVPANDRRRNAIEVARRTVWWLYRQLKDYKLTPDPRRAAELSARFDRIFKRRTGYATLDRLLRRLLKRKDELLRVLERPDIPLNTNASENDIRAFVTKRKNLRRNGQRKRPSGPRRHARPRQDLQETQNSLLRLSRRPPRNTRARRPPPRDPRHPSSRLSRLAPDSAPITDLRPYQRW
jgi:hypothetical protein